VSQAPQDLERTDEQPKGQYVTKRDFKVIVIVLVCLAVLLSPVYFVLKDGSDAYICKKNLNSISKALVLYSNDNDGKLPPAYVTINEQGAPYIENNAIYGWANLVDAYMKSDASFRCPKSTKEENYLDHHADGSLMEVSYGLYAPYAGYSLSDIEDADSVILVAEVCNRGANDTYDPHPILDADGNPAPYDAFVIGWSNGNLAPDETTTSVTRLAFPNSKGGTFDKDGSSRHPGGNHFLTATGRALSLPPSAAKVEWNKQKKKAIGIWMTPDFYLMDKKRGG